MNEELKHSDGEELKTPDRQEFEEILEQTSEEKSEDLTQKETEDIKEEKKQAKKSSKKEKLTEELESAKQLAEEYKRKWYSVSAEYDNYRKRNQTAVSQAYADGKAEAVLKLLPVSDTFGYAYDGADERTKAGIDKIIKNFNNVLLSMGIEEIPVNVGDVFDENVAEAIMTVPSEEGEAPNQVKQILKKGYRQGEKVIRYAQVIVTV